VHELLVLPTSSAYPKNEQIPTDSCRLSRSWTTEGLCRQVYNEGRGAFLLIGTLKNALAKKHPKKVE
jgi:hypothetical protein